MDDGLLGSDVNNISAESSHPPHRHGVYLRQPSSTPLSKDLFSLSLSLSLSSLPTHLTEHVVGLSALAALLSALPTLLAYRWMDGRVAPPNTFDTSAPLGRSGQGSWPLSLGSPAGLLLAPATNQPPTPGGYQVIRAPNPFCPARSRLMSHAVIIDLVFGFESVAEPLLQPSLLRTHQEVRDGADLSSPYAERRPSPP